MTARARVLAVTADVHVLVLDRLGMMTAEQVQRLIDAAKTNDVFRAVLVFPFDLDLPEVDAHLPANNGVQVHADEAEAVERLWAVHQGYTGAELRVGDEQALTLLLNRAREARS